MVTGYGPHQYRDGFDFITSYERDYEIGQIFQTVTILFARWRSTRIRDSAAKLFDKLKTITDRHILKEDKKQESSKMETNEIRAVIKYLCKKGMSPKEIYEYMSTVKKWVAAFKLGRISNKDEHRPGRPAESVTQENIDKIHDLVMLDRRMTVRQIEKTLGIPKTTVDRIMGEHLGLRKLSACRGGKPRYGRTTEKKKTFPVMLQEVEDSRNNFARLVARSPLATSSSADTAKYKQKKIYKAKYILHIGEIFSNTARWVPKLLTPDLKAVRKKLSSDNLALFEANPEEIVNRFVTMDETWAYHFTPESKQQYMQWSHSGSPPSPQESQDSSISREDFLNKGQTITANYYANLVKQLREAIKEKRRGKLSRKIVYHQDNAPSHR
ncbi:hypothetical protein LAZ67_1001504 [Cordylochernes scorpioides]|uniref:Transposase n=1 Tax=Cordylochernes scorpioides TaxID=51811 RepID=A0ABY6K055_9ARAC|nr:hypothetical protein LAZ67_1001504 [Cordylochernes scorpioides]